MSLESLRSFTLPENLHSKCFFRMGEASAADCRVYVLLFRLTGFPLCADL